MYDPVAPSGLRERSFKQESGGGVSDLLDDFTGLLDTEWRLIVAAFVAAFSAMYGFACCLIIYISMPPVATFWYVMLVTCVMLCAASVVYLVEPRPSHWLPALSQIEFVAWTSSFAEKRARAMRWWRWRKKYAARSKLNV